MKVPRDLEAMWKMSKGDPAVSDAAALEFDAAGLIWVAPPRHHGYDATPRNSVTFAHTGGDGVHYGWLDLPGGEPDSAPIVMTIPCAMDANQNIVVGESLRDFLHLGCRYGYFALEQLAYDWDGTVEELEKKRVDPDALPEKLAKLNQLTKHFALSPWSNPRDRLIELRDRFAHLIVVGTH